MIFKLLLTATTLFATPLFAGEGLTDQEKGSLFHQCLTSAPPEVGTQALKICKCMVIKTDEYVKASDLPINKVPTPRQQKEMMDAIQSCVPVTK